MYPWQELAQYAESVLDGVSVYEAPAAQLDVPALVIRPDNPWRRPDSFCYDLQTYVAIGVVTASTPESGIAHLYRIHSALIAGLPEGWKFDRVGTPALDQSTGRPYLASALYLTYSNHDETVSEEPEE